MSSSIEGSVYANRMRETGNMQVGGALGWRRAWDIGSKRCRLVGRRCGYSVWAGCTGGILRAIRCKRGGS
ncbi:hypothetical protein NSPZN2_50247 [Nitrospira defluvii]|uniref:Uncharacterized protein n=1 Tax=Nitrospira defluvii TaxID=330214 RepID=A0ABN7M9T3_9BACT|nr:hypothetical protein NSPZN2_50247 [Nitrospira defluvii]